MQRWQLVGWIMATGKLIVAFSAEIIRDVERQSQERLVFKPNAEMTFLLVTLARAKNVRIVVWSAKGKKYAQEVVERLGLREYVWRCAEKSLEVASEYSVALSFDDRKMDLAEVNILIRNTR